MGNDELINRGKELTNELSDILRKVSDKEAIEMLGSGALDNLIKSILNPKDREKYPNLQEFFLANKWRGTLIALLRHAIQNNYSVKGVTEDGSNGYVSPSYIQWFDDGVMILQGNGPFEGFLGLYRNNGELSYAIAAREAKPGELMGPEYFEFVNPDKFKESLAQFSKKQPSNLKEPIERLEFLLLSKDNDESKYQELLSKYPWVLGLSYQSIQRHTKLDDKNIPDFTALRIHDNHHDVIEIKPPFTKMFRDNGEIGNEFNDAWNQAERYLDFVRQDKDYLSRKGLKFDNPKCYLILGYNLTPEEVALIRTKERLNPAINLLTYNDLLVFMKATVSFVEKHINK